MMMLMMIVIMMTVVMMMMTVHSLFGSCLRCTTSSASPSNEPIFLVIRHSSEIRSVCLWMEVLLGV